jgi:hypothetical protein
VLIKVAAAVSRKHRETRCLRFDQCCSVTREANRSSVYMVWYSGVIVFLSKYY